MTTIMLPSFLFAYKLSLSYIAYATHSQTATSDQVLNAGLPACAAYALLSTLYYTLYAGLPLVS